MGAIRGDLACLANTEAFQQSSRERKKVEMRRLVRG
jgi:hypothetical protein